MTKLEYELLNYIKHHDAEQWIDVINAFDPQKQANKVDDYLRTLLECKLIEPTTRPESPPHCRLQITPSGQEALRHAKSFQHPQADHQQRKSKEREKLNQNWKIVFAAVSGIVALISGIVTILDFLVG